MTQYDLLWDLFLKHLSRCSSCPKKDYCNEGLTALKELERVARLED